MSSALSCASRSAAVIARAAPTSEGITMSPASALMPAPANSARISAPRARAWSKSSSTSMPAPSPSTRPRRCLQNGRQVSSASTRIASHARKTPSVRQASVPPASATSATPERTSANACANAWLADEHALDTAKLGPVMPNSIDTCEAGALIIRRTIESGCKRGLCSPYRRREPSSLVSSPPVPVPTTQALRWRRSPCAKSMPDCLAASRAATSANCETRSSRISFFESKCVAGSKSRTCAATFTRMSWFSNPVSGAMALFPSRMPVQIVRASWPNAQIAPTPVMTTRRFMAKQLRGGRRRGRWRRRVRGLVGQQFFHGIDQSLHRFGVEVGIAVGHLDLEVVFDLENDLDRVQRRNLEILQRRIQRDLALVDARFLGDDRKHRLLYIVAHGGFPSASWRAGAGGAECASPPSNRIPATMMAEPRIFSQPIG